MPAVARLCDWSQQADLWLLSNHRHEWVLPGLEMNGVAHRFSRLIVSSEVKAMKPDPVIYADLREGNPSEVCFVDDKQENLDAALAAGTVDVAVLADPECEWIRDVERWLASA